jgi:hypothetical protein
MVVGSGRKPRARVAHNGAQPRGNPFRAQSGPVDHAGDGAPGRGTRGTLHHLREGLPTPETALCWQRLFLQGPGHERGSVNPRLGVSTGIGDPIVGSDNEMKPSCSRMEKLPRLVAVSREPGSRGPLAEEYWLNEAQALSA